MTGGPLLPAAALLQPQHLRLLITSSRAPRLRCCLVAGGGGGPAAGHGAAGRGDPAAPRHACSSSGRALCSLRASDAGATCSPAPAAHPAGSPSRARSCIPLPAWRPGAHGLQCQRAHSARPPLLQSLPPAAVQLEEARPAGAASPPRLVLRLPGCAEPPPPGSGGAAAPTLWLVVDPRSGALRAQPPAAGGTPPPSAQALPGAEEANAALAQGRLLAPLLQLWRRCAAAHLCAVAASLGVLPLGPGGAAGAAALRLPGGAPLPPRWPFLPPSPQGAATAACPRSLLVPFRGAV